MVKGFKVPPIGASVSSSNLLSQSAAQPQGRLIRPASTSSCPARWWPQVAASCPRAVSDHWCPRLGPPEVRELEVRRGARTWRQESAPEAGCLKRSREPRVQRGTARHPDPGDPGDTTRSPTFRDLAIAPPGDPGTQGPTVPPGHSCPLFRTLVERGTR